jgi:hypothetical protein
MDMRGVAIVAGLLVAGSLAFAPAAVTANDAAAKKPAAKKIDIAKTAVTATSAADHTGSVKRRKPAPPQKSAHTPAAANAYAAMPEADRLAIQSDLAWLGDYQGVAAGNFDDHVIDAIKAFQKRNGGKATGILTDQERTLLAAAAKAPQRAVGWRLIEDSASGTRLGLPSTLVPKVGAGRTGSRWTSGQGQIQIETFRLREAALPALFDEEKRTPRQRSIAYSALKPDSFVIAGEQKLKKFLVRAQASGGELRGVTILYDQATDGTMDRVAIAIANTFEGFPDPNVAPPPGSRRSVEYGTAIVVSGRGDLITLGQVTDQCLSITVPGFGHAARIAEDKANDLALIRLYGARNLVAAPLAGDSANSDDLTLVGIAAPLARAGGGGGSGAVTTAAAHLMTQGVEPAPERGFSGAAAIDAQGRFAGLVELKSPVVAGAVSQQATLIPADAVRAFLAAHRIAPAAGRAAIEPSVVRVICVRN